MRNGFWGCGFCQGRGCLACEAESRKRYALEFPDGPKPIMTIKAEYSQDLASLQDDGNPNIESPAEFPEIVGNDSLSVLVRTALAMMPGRGV